MGSVGAVNAGLKHDPDQVEADFGADLGDRMVALSGNAPNVVFRLIERHQVECDALQSGTLRAAFGARDAGAVRASAEQGIRRGAPVELLESDAARDVTGTERYVCAMLNRRGGQVNPLGYARGLARAAMQAGAAVLGATPALEVKRNGTWNVRTPTGTVRADKLVLATNGYTDGVWPGLRRGVVPVFSAIVTSEPLPWAPMQSVLYELGRVAVYYRSVRSREPSADGWAEQRDITEPRPWNPRVTAGIATNIASCTVRSYIVEKGLGQSGAKHVRIDPKLLPSRVDDSASQ